MTPIRILIVDDEPLGRERIRSLLADNEAVEIVGECENGREAVSALDAGEIDLVFLDVQMPEMNGFEVIRTIGADAMPHVIFVTAYDRHALGAFEVHALDYLLKPFEVERFNDALRRAIQHIRQDQQSSMQERIHHLLTDVRQPPQWLNRIIVKTRSHLYFIQASDIEWIEAAGNYVSIHAGGKQHLLRQTLTTLEQQLDPDKFMRIHRSAIINIDRVKALYPMASGEYEVHLDTGQKLTLSRSYRQLLDKFMP